MPESLETLFERARDAIEVRYVVARELLLARGPEAETFLLQKMQSSAPVEERWLTEILLARLSNGDEFQRLEAVFDAKVRHIKLGYPHEGYIPQRLDLLSGLSLPDEKVPAKSGAGTDLAPEIMAFFEATRIPASANWPPMLAEVLMKGWTATKLPAAPPVALEHDALTGLAAAGPGDRIMTAQDYEIQAMLLLAKLGENRAGPFLLRILQDTTKQEEKRGIAARALGLLRDVDAVDTLLRLAQDDRTHYFIRVDVFGALGKIDDPRVLSGLQSIAAWPANKTPGNLGPGRWAEEAQIAIRHLQHAIKS